MNRALTSARTLPSFPVRRPWNSADFLGDVQMSDLRKSNRMEHVEELFLFDMNTEYDAMNLLRHLRSKAAGGSRFSADFWAFVDAWQADEWNHYVGYRHLYSLCTGRSTDDIHAQVQARPVDFRPVESFLDDEFKICLVIAYDEMFTIWSCKQDYDLFDTFEKPRASRWIRRVARDESFHFQNALEVVRRQHAHRVGEAPGFLNSILEWDLEAHEYNATFVLDHEEWRYDTQMLEGLRDKIVSHINRRSGPLNA
jgi:hypothetical protein